MLREDQNRSHRDTVNAIRREIRLSSEDNPVIDVVRDLKEIDIANEHYIRARSEYSTVNSDRTMTNLIGAWAHLNRLIMLMDDKYGTRE